MRLLKASVAHASPKWTFLHYDNKHYHIAILQSPDVQQKAQDVLHAGLDHVACTCSSLTALARTYSSLKQPTEVDDANATLAPALKPI